MIKIITLMCTLFILFALKSNAQKITYNKYHTPEEVEYFITTLSKTSPGVLKRIELAQTTTGRTVSILEIKKEKKTCNISRGKP